MDVTALLNASVGTDPIVRRDSLEHTPTPSVAEVSTAPSTALPTPSPEKSPSRRSSDSRPGNRNRTPWDAGGYSLPLSLETKFPPTAAKPAFYSESDVENAGSTSSCAISSSPSCRSPASTGSSPVDMATSNVVSPISTTRLTRPAFLGELEPHLEISTERRPSILSDGEAQLTARKRYFVGDSEAHHASGSPKSPKHKFSDSHSSLSSYVSSTQSGCHSRISSLSTVSGIQPLSSLLSDTSLEAKPLRRNSAAGQPPQDSKFPAWTPPQPSQNGSPPTVPEVSGLDVGRPCSPSDAILIPRGSSSNRSSSAEGSSPRNLKQSLLQPPELPHVKTHKRAISAPDFPAITAPSFHPFPTLAETSPFQNRPAFTMAATSAADPAPPVAEEPVECMYTTNCNTGAVPRKVISHMFGRNKLCTRMIPQSVWVHYCRKHYQRVRYRNGPEYAKLQVDLVIEQIKRVQRWSDDNVTAGRPGVVQNWHLSIRKREQKRLEDKKSKREFDVENDDDDVDGAILNGTAVPDWLLRKCDAAVPYRTDQVEAIILQLKSEINSGRLAQIPDIEILPNISGDGAEAAGQRKPAQKRKSLANGGTAHRRTQSMGVALQPESLPMARRVSQPNNYWVREDDGDASHFEKRQRLADIHDGRTPLPPVRRMHGLPHRPAFSNIPEDNQYGRPQMPPVSFANPPPVEDGRYLGPYEPRSHGPPHEETRRPFHSRSRSDMPPTEFGHAPSYPSGSSYGPALGHRPSSSGGYQSNPRGYEPIHESRHHPYPPRRPSHSYTHSHSSLGQYAEQRPHISNPNPFQAAPRSPRLPSIDHGDRSYGPPVGPHRPTHTRHQSSPNAMRLMHRTPSQGYHGLPPMSGRAEPFAAPAEEPRRYSVATPNDTMFVKRE